MLRSKAESPGVVLITGASSGFGKACAEHFSRCGYLVYGTSRRAGAETGANNRRTSSPAWTIIPMDVRDQASVEAGVANVLERTGRIDVLVNNAGIAIAGAVEDTSVDEVKEQFETNFFGTYRVTRAVVPVMRMQGGGHILNISSVAGVMGIPFQSAYSASKFAIEGMTESLRIEVRPFGIHVVLVEPGDFRTGMTQNRKIADAAETNAVYREKFRTALNLMENEEKNGLPPEKLAHRVEKIIRRPVPKPRYTIGKVEQRFSTVVKRLIPAALFEKAMIRYYHLR